MAEAGATPKQVNPVPNAGDRDRVAMLSLNADGTPDQHNPEVIGDKAAATAAAKAQFAQQSVSAVDVERNVARTNPGQVTIVGKPGDEPDEVVPLTTGQDPAVMDAQQAHEKAAKAAEVAAEKTVDRLHNGIGDTTA